MWIFVKQVVYILCKVTPEEIPVGCKPRSRSWCAQNQNYFSEKAVEGFIIQHFEFIQDKIHLVLLNHPQHEVCHANRLGNRQLLPLVELCV